ncbi:MAG: hypothetical protein WAK96_05580 [Desulfobaccales bacterium]
MRDFWRETQEFNQRPLNQLAEEALRVLKVDPDPTNLYLLQLVRWCLDHGQMRLVGPSQAQYVLREHLDAFHGWSPEVVMELFEKNSAGDPVEIYPKGPVNPARLAEATLEQLDSRLSASVPGYPVAKPE